jgi:predicted small secreted protein
MSTFIKRVLASALMLAVAAMAAVGCNTMRGMGQDLQEGGQAIQDAATKTQQK